VKDDLTADGAGKLICLKCYIASWRRPPEKVPDAASPELKHFLWRDEHGRLWHRWYHKDGRLMNSRLAEDEVPADHPCPERLNPDASYSSHMLCTVCGFRFLSGHLTSVDNKVLCQECKEKHLASTGPDKSVGGGLSEPALAVGGVGYCPRCGRRDLTKAGQGFKVFQSYVTNPDSASLPSECVIVDQGRVDCWMCRGCKRMFYVPA
jgi:hypothetical protein